MSGSARPVPWLSLGVEGAWAERGYAWALIGPEPLARSPFHFFAVVRGHLMLSRRVEAPFGALIGLAGERWLFRDPDRPSAGSCAETNTGVGGGEIGGFHFYPIDALAIDVENAFLVSSLHHGQQADLSLFFRLGLSYHFR